jgi:hypothetical protein
LNCFVKVVIITRRTVFARATSRFTRAVIALSCHLLFGGDHPGMTEKLLRADSQVAILLEAMIKKIFHNL